MSVPEPVQAPAGEETTGRTRFGADREIIAVRVDGALWDLDRPLPPGASAEPVRIGSPDGLAILRHSTAHVLAQAVQRINPQARLGIGPPVTDGFYYDFDVAAPFTPEDLKALSKEMERIQRAGQRFERRVVTEAEARELFAAEPYKLELIGLKASVLEGSVLEGSVREGSVREGSVREGSVREGSAHRGAAGSAEEAVEVGAGELTVYANVDRSTGETVWQDLCRGPHLPNTGLIRNGWALTRVAAAYWRGSERNPQLQRIYGTAWPSKDELREYQHRVEEAAKRDHRKLGAELDLFSFPDEIGSGLAVFHPRGGVVRQEMEDYSRRRHAEAGYSFVNSPHVTKANLFQTSGHLQWFADGMFPPIHLDEEVDAEGNVTRAGQDYYLKPMNCPFHNLIFRARGRSYRELPLRLFEFGSVYRYEKSGTLAGLTRVRGMTQDDAHLYVTPEQLKPELTRTLRFVLDLLRDYGLDDFYLELSTRDDGPKFMGPDELWETATATLAEVATESGLRLQPDPGGAAFYGPKISVQAKDAIGRTWQLSTIQIDFNQPARFGLEYTAADGTRQQPIMIHRALFGSIERFFAVLLEHYAGAFPVWLSPVQAVGIPVADEYLPYLEEVLDRLRSAGVRAELDASDDRMQKKIRTATLQHVPFLLIAGAEDRDAGAVSFRFRDGTTRNGVPVDEAVALITGAIRDRLQVSTADDLVPAVSPDSAAAPPGGATGAPDAAAAGAV